MIVNQWAKLGTLLATSCILAACGGGDSSDASTSQTQTTTTVPSQLMAGKGIIITQGEAAAPSSPSVQAGTVFDRPMAGFQANGDHGAFNSAVKLLISSVGPQKLIVHLQAFTQTTADEVVRQAAESFITLINRAYESERPVSSEVQSLIADLQVLKIPHALAAGGMVGFALDGTENARELLDKLTMAFDLNSMPGWNVKTTSVQSQATQTIHTDTRENAAELYHVIDLELLGKHAVGSISLQQAMDLLHQDLERRKESDGTEVQTPPIQISRSLSARNVADIQHFSIMPKTNENTSITFKTTEQVSLPVLDERTGKQMQLTLQPTSVLLSDGPAWSALIQSGNGKWSVHRDAAVDLTGTVPITGTARFITLTVLQAVPAQ